MNNRKRKTTGILTKRVVVLFLGVAITTIGLTSCESHKAPTQHEIVRSNIEEHIKPKMNDPESYEFAELILADSVLYKDNIEYRKEYFERNLGYDQENLERQEKYKKEIPSIFNPEEVEELNSKIETNKKILSEIDRLETELGETVHEVASYTYIFRFRAVNGLGAKMLNEYLVQTNPAPDLGIINIADDRDELLLNPNDFPGYKAMLQATDK
ncbi:hypothetical protein HCG49_16660 [Arenibacter sp. 6A1]|uniref:hypothetical protein n=1 Tax=Arenibacter sp. 6A1 TaxID=2720391 RepID=UPI001444A26B|nr:hypothetical protein [Arenibacter sp. 6A1]NKI28188.1 hypothetical protein [Arenibacter sp. 6A1]